MAKAKSGFQISTVSAKDAHDTLSKLRRGRGGRSKYQPILEAVQKAAKGKLVEVKGVAKNEVQALRTYLYRSLDKGEYTVKSARQSDGAYTVAVGRTEDFE